MVNTAEELRWCLVNQQSCQLMKDIDLGGQNGKNWTGININQAITIDGNGYTVYNLYSDVNVNPGFIASVSNGNSGFIMKNFTLSNVKAYTRIGAAYGSHAAALIAQFNAGTVDNCVIKGALVDGNGASHGIGGVFSPADSGSSGITIKNTKAINVYVYGGSCVSDFIEGPWDGQRGPLTVENCAAVDGVAISTGGHSGGFTSCVRTYADNIKYKNCYTNVDVYGNTDTGVFAGVTHAGTHRFENCYASGKIEGTNNIGGFVGVNSAGTQSVFTNCYSTSMVGMSNGGSNMGGFAGAGDNTFYFNNCYAAGEVGTLNSKSDGTPIGATNVRGFSGNNGGHFTNCYYDKQTTAMCDYGSEPTGVTGLLTKELIATNLNVNNDDTWMLSSGGYPELKVFAGLDNAFDKAYSKASVSTVMLYPSNLSDEDYKKVDKSNYDTVRRIRYVFPLTSDANVDKSYHIKWEIFEGEDPNNPLYPNKSPLLEGDVPIITLADVGVKDNVSAVAPGIGWLQVNATIEGQTGMRRLRLVPTTSIGMVSMADAVMGTDCTIYTVPEDKPENYRDLKEEETKYDHRDNISFVTVDAEKLNSFVLDEGNYSKLEDKLTKHQINSKSFPKEVEHIVSEDQLTLEYNLGADLNNDLIRITIGIKQEDGTFKALEWTDELISLVTKGRTCLYSRSDKYPREFRVERRIYRRRDTRGSRTDRGDNRGRISRWT